VQAIVEWVRPLAEIQNNAVTSNATIAATHVFRISLDVSSVI